MNNRIRPLALFGFTGLLMVPLHATPIKESFSFSGGAVPDGNPSGLVLHEIPALTIDSIHSITISVDLWADFAGDVYFYVSHAGRTAMLFNRPGSTASNPFGNPDGNGFRITFSDDATSDIHTYPGTAIPSDGSPITGTWQPDGRLVDPDLVTDASPRSAFLSEFFNTDAKSPWDFYVADLSSGGQTFLNKVDVIVGGQVSSTVPESSNSLLLLLTGALFLIILRKKSCPHPH